MTSRVVQSFERYIQTIQPDDEELLRFITEKLARNGITDPRAVPYVQLYTRIKSAVREYIDQGTPHSEPPKSHKKG